MLITFFSKSDEPIMTPHFLKRMQKENKKSQEQSTLAIEITLV